MADFVLFLDFPRTLCLRRVTWRALSGFGRTRADLAPGCPEKIDFAFHRYIWQFGVNQRPRIVTALANATGEVLTLRRQRDVNAFLANLPATRP